MARQRLHTIMASIRRDLCFHEFCARRSCKRGLLGLPVDTAFLERQPACPLAACTRRNTTHIPRSQQAARRDGQCTKQHRPGRRCFQTFWSGSKQASQTRIRRLYQVLPENLLGATRPHAAQLTYLHGRIGRGHQRFANQYSISPEPSQILQVLRATYAAQTHHQWAVKLRRRAE